MSGMNVALRPFTWDDLPIAVDLINRSEAVDQVERSTSEGETRMGRALLLEGMHALRRRGCTHLTLGVDTENPTGALRLYESVGFREWSTGVTFRKVLRGEGVSAAASLRDALDQAAGRAPS